MLQTDNEDPDRQSVIVMTGATAGIGAHALKRIASSDVRVLVGTRGTPPVHGEPLPLDLASLASVRSFAARVLGELGSAQIDVLILNAGASFPGTSHQSEDGFERTFAVNHLAHYLLARLLLPKMAPQSRLVITTSDVHARAPDTLDVRRWSRPGGGGPGMQAYASSKLCNLLTARALVIQDEVKSKDCRVIAYNPGLTVDTSLARHAPAWMRMLMGSRVLRVFLRLFSHFVPMMYPGTAERAGEALSQLALGSAAPPPGRVYASLVRGELTYPDPSPLASDDDARDTLWKQSAEMCGWSESQPNEEMASNSGSSQRRRSG